MLSWVGVGYSGACPAVILDFRILDEDVSRSLSVGEALRIFGC